MKLPRHPFKRRRPLKDVVFEILLLTFLCAWMGITMGLDPYV